jgi:hypothetical protein
VGSSHTAHLGARNEALSNLLGVSTVRSDENKKTRTVNGVEESVVSLTGLLLASSDEVGTLRRGDLGLNGGLSASELREVALTVEELGKSILDLGGVEGEALVVGYRGVPAEQRPPATGDGTFGLAETLKRTSLLDSTNGGSILLLTPRKVGKDERRAREGLGLTHGVNHASIVGVDSNRGNVDVTKVERVESKVLFALALLLSKRRERRGLSLVNEEVDVKTRNQGVVETGRSEVGSPRVGDDNPESTLGPVSLGAEGNDLSLISIGTLAEGSSGLVAGGARLLVVLGEEPVAKSRVDIGAGLRSLQDLLNELNETLTLSADGNGLTKGVKRRCGLAGSKVGGVVENLEGVRRRGEERSVGRLGSGDGDRVRGNLGDGGRRAKTSKGGTRRKSSLELTKGLGSGNENRADGNVKALEGVDNTSPSGTVLSGTGLNHNKLASLNSAELLTRDGRSEDNVNGTSGRKLCRDKVEDDTSRLLSLSESLLRAASELEETKRLGVKGLDSLLLELALCGWRGGSEESSGVNLLDLTLESSGSDKVVDNGLNALGKTKSKDSVVVGLLRVARDDGNSLGRARSVGSLSAKDVDDGTGGRLREGREEGRVCEK